MPNEDELVWSEWKRVEHEDGTVSEYREAVVEINGEVTQLREGRTELRGVSMDHPAVQAMLEQAQSLREDVLPLTCTRCGTHIDPDDPVSTVGPGMSGGKPTPRRIYCGPCARSLGILGD